MGIFRKKKQPQSQQTVEQASIKKEEQAKEAKASFVLREKDVAIQLSAKDKDDAIIQVADYLIKNGRVSEEYKQGMLDRETQVSTYLMNGVAIPHGVGEAKQYIKDSGIFIGQFPKGVVWNENGDVVYLVCALASDSDAHMDVLTKLTMILQEEAEVKKLVETDSVDVLVKSFSKEVEEEKPSKIEIKGLSKKILFTGENGMHARPATLLAKMAKEYKDTDIFMHTDVKSATMKSMPSILKLNISPQTNIVVSADGANAEEALEKIVRYIEDDLNHEKANTPTEDEESIFDPIELEKDSTYITGVKASPGVAVGKIFKLVADEFTIKERAADKQVELTLYEKSRETAKEQLQALMEEMKSQGLENESDIIESHIMSIEDEEIVGSILKLIEDGYSASYGVSQVYREQAISLEKLEDPVLSARALDMKDVRERLLRILENKSSPHDLPVEEPFILVAEELTPSQTASLSKHPVLGLCTALGGETSHMAILARALGLPALVGMGKEVMELEEDHRVILDAQAGNLITNPSEKLIVKATEMSDKLETFHKKEEAEAMEEAITEDGVKIEVLCNIANAEDADAVISKGGEGVGLFRTEFLFENAPKRPTVDEQYQAYLKVAKALPNVPIIVRVMDIGGDKPVSWLEMPKEDNPFLGIRGVRLLFRSPQLFKDQLEAIYRAAMWQRDQGQKVGFHIMIPMIAKTSEYVRSREIAEEVRASIGAPVVPLGVMIETPSAALIAEHLAKEVDFFSIGTNDLTQYTLAMDRVHPEMTKEAESLHPSVLRLIHMTVEGGNLSNKFVGVCGNMAADPVMLSVLISLGLREVSVSPANVATVKYLIRRLDTRRLKELKEKVLNSGSGTEVRKMCEAYFKKNLVNKL